MAPLLKLREAARLTRSSHPAPVLTSASKKLFPTFAIM